MADASKSSLEQSWAYGEAVARVQACRVRRCVVLQHDRPLALVQAFEKRSVLPVALVHIMRGPLWLGPVDEPALRLAAYKAIKRAFRLTRRELLFWMPELPAGADSIALLRACGKRQMVTGYSSIWLDLRQSAEALRAALHGKWRNALHRAEQSELRVRSGPGAGQLDWLLDRYEAERRRKRHIGPPANLLRAYADVSAKTRDMIILCAYQDEVPIAGVIVLVHGKSATYSVGWTSDAGRRAAAHNLLLWRAILALQKQKVAWLDLGGVNTTRTPGLARFKLGLGGEVFTLAGTFL